MNLRIFLEQQAGHGEDKGISGEHYAFVFDGLGGSGGKIRTNSNGVTMTEAKIASTAAAARMEELLRQKWQFWAEKLDFSSQDALKEYIRRQIVETIQKEMLDALKKAAREFNAYDKESRLPTTIAGWISFPTPDQKTLAIALWAGDSRCYLLDERGMKQCSKDSTFDYLDPMEELSTDCRLKNLLRVNESFEIEYNCRVIDGPALLMCCSDGFYRGIESPMHVEYQLRSVLGQGDSIENMQQLWSEFFLEPRVEDRPETNLFHDDSATMEAVFVGSTPEDFTAMKAMLLAPLPDLEQKLNDAIPDLYQVEEVDIEQKIVGIAAQLKRNEDKFHFYENLKENIRRYVTTDAEYPASLPCAALVKSLKPEGEALKRRNLEAWEAQKECLRQETETAKNKMEAHLNAMKKIVILTSEVESPMNGRVLVKDLINSFKSQKWEDFDFRVYNLSCCIRTNFENVVEAAHFGKSSFSNINTPDEEMGQPKKVDPQEELEELDNRLSDLIHVSNWMADKGNLGRKLQHVNNIQRKTEKKLQPLSTQEAKLLREYVLNKAKGLQDLMTLDKILDPMPENGVYQTLQPADIPPLLDLAVEYTEMERKKASLVEAPITVPDAKFEQMLEQSLKEYLLRKPTADAKYLITEWYEKQQKPAYFQMDRSLENTLTKGVNKLVDIECRNSEIRNQHEQWQKAIFELWNRYRVHYEGWNDPFIYVSPPAEERLEIHAGEQMPEEHPQPRTDAAKGTNETGRVIEPNSQAQS